jgi:arylsulfatase A-like enzyme
MARALDEGMGNVTAALKRGSLWDEAIIVWSADNVRQAAM